MLFSPSPISAIVLVKPCASFSTYTCGIALRMSVSSTLSISLSRPPFFIKLLLSRSRKSCMSSLVSLYWKSLADSKMLSSEAFLFSIMPMHWKQLSHFFPTSNIQFPSERSLSSLSPRNISLCSSVSSLSCEMKWRVGNTSGIYLLSFLKPSK